MNGFFRRSRLLAAFFPLRFTQWLGPLVAAGALAAFLAVVVVTAGLPDLSASTPHPQGWASLLHYVFNRSTRHHAASAVIPADFGTPAQIAKGAGYYGTACAHCHGGPGLGQNPVAMSMRPRPQYLVNEIGTFSDRDLFWIVKHGVKYSGMPAWPVADRDDEVWSVVSFLRAMPKLNSAQYRTLAYGDAADGNTPAPVPVLAATFSSHGYAATSSDELAPNNYFRSTPSIGFDSFSLNDNVAATCVRCHTGGGHGRIGGAVPDITLLDPVYFRDALTRFSRNARHSGFMLPVATQLSQEQMAELATWFTAQPRRAADPPQVPPAALALGQRIAAAGLDADRTGACSNCHDITRRSTVAFPVLDGQHFAYLRGRMLQFRNESAAPLPGGNPMLVIARAMNDRQIDAVSGYYASRAPAAGRSAVALAAAK